MGGHGEPSQQKTEAPWTLPVSFKMQVIAAGFGEKAAPEVSRSVVGYETGLYAVNCPVRLRH